jgi:pimeloyl-ACP methyl ester carboxylesterase
MGNSILSRNNPYGIAALLLVALSAFFVPHPASAIDQTQAVKMAREYLLNKDAAERTRLLEKLERHDGDIDAVLKKLRERSYKSVKTGYRPREHFSEDDLLKKHPDDLLFFMVPREYMPDRSAGLIVFMHGGGSTTSRRAPGAFLDYPDNDGSYTNEMGDVFAATGMIAVGPSALWNEDSSYRWCLPETDEYLADVVLECNSRFNIDPDRVILIGHSMGGFGAFHHAQRQPDRFAAVVANSGSWSLGYWPVIQGTPLCIVQGEHDARKGVRWHYTDIAYGRWTNKILNRDEIDHLYLEHAGKHGIGYGKAKIAEYLETAKNLRRDPYYPHVVLASPVGFRQSYSFPVEHNRWLTLNEAAKGNLKYDELIGHGNDSFDDWHLEHETERLPGAMIDAKICGDNALRITTKNVARFTVWLHPKMVDVKKPVTIEINGKKVFSESVRPSLATAMESYDRRSDWGLVYPVKIGLQGDK